MSLRNKIIFLTAFSFSFSLNAQEFERVLNKIPVSDISGIIPNTFSSGHNNIEHQYVDIDGDADLDIIYLDSDKTYGWYKNIGNEFNHNFILSFDTIPGMKFSDWFFLIDIDDDNDLDIFTGGAPALIEFRRNIGTTTNPFFELEVDTLFDNENNPMFSEFGCNPVFIDIDNDNDYDFLSGNSSGTVTFYENIGNNISFNLKFITNSWQNISIQGGALKPDLHGASALDFADIDNDNDYDLFWGDFFGRSIYFIQNNGNATTAVMDTPYTFSGYPQNKDSVWTSGFNMPRLADIDSDNDLDFFVSVLYDPTVPQSLMFYRNLGTTENPDLNLENENFLKTLDVGGKSSPVFIDIDSDEDLDLFTGSEKITNGTLHFFENIGTSINPSFILNDSSYFGIEGDLTITPSFGDIDDDGDYDLLVGEFIGRFSLYENTGTQFSPNFQLVGQLRDSSNNFISVGNYARPFLIDIDNDSDPDLITGGFNGHIRLYRNIGTANNYNFILQQTYFNLDVGDNSSPFVIDYDDDGDFDLFTGSDSVTINDLGNILFYRNDGNNLNPQWVLISENFLSQTFGGFSFPTFVDINNDTDKDLFIGNVKGGLYYFENNLITNIIDEEQQPYNFNLEVFPNPFNSQTNILVNVNKTEEVTISIYNTLGEKVIQLFSGNLQTGKNEFTWNGKNDKGANISSGIYFVVVKTFDKLKSIKLILLK
ncbi:MAG TPA: T9SS type A sorting domain-containing protein [Ignavibacteriaceae bacterium]|nr:T9SS type A sorting domain-containing protein [Ignavibacteriaceae bacterium]